LHSQNIILIAGMFDILELTFVPPFLLQKSRVGAGTHVLVPNLQPALQKYASSKVSSKTQISENSEY